MKILYISNIDTTKTNGAVKHINAFAMEMKARKFEVKQFHYEFNKKNSISNFLFYIDSMNFIFRYYREIDIIYIRYFPLCFLQIIIGRLLNKHVFIEYNSVIEEEVKEIFPKVEKLANIIKLFSKYSAKLSTGIIVLSQGIGEYISETYKIKMEKIHISSNGGNILDLQEKRQIGNKGVIAINDIGWYKVDDIIDIKKLLIKHGIFLDIYLATDKEDRYGNEIICNSSIDFQNYDWGLVLNDKEKGKNRYKYGIRPIKYFEYLSYGLPVIIPDIRDINAITKEHNVGIVFRNDDSKSIVDAVIRMYDEDGLLYSMSNNALKLVKNKYSWEKLVSEINCFINKRINGKVKNQI